MSPPGTPDWRPLCPLDAIPDGAARGFDPDGRGEDTLFAVRQGDRVRVYRNHCPHNGRPLEYQRHRFLSADGSRIVCYAHNAQFRIEDGVCTYGPCLGAALGGVPARIDGGQVMVWHRDP